MPVSRSDPPGPPGDRGSPTFSAHPSEVPPLGWTEVFAKPGFERCGALSDTGPLVQKQSQRSFLSWRPPGISP